MVPKWSGPRRNAPAAAATHWSAVLGEFGADDQDALDGAIGRVADGDGAGAGRLEAAASVFVAQPEHSLRRAQVMDGVIGHEFAITALHAGPTNSAVRRHQVGVFIAKAIFSGG